MIDRTAYPGPSFEVSRADGNLINLIAERAVYIALRYNIELGRLEIAMDVTACHANGCPLDLKRLLECQDVDFVYDMAGIHRHLDRNTGTLRNCFVPRCAKVEP